MIGQFSGLLGACFLAVSSQEPFSPYESFFSPPVIPQLQVDYDEAWDTLDFSSCQSTNRLRPQSLSEIIRNAGKVRFRHHI
jgi:hypothetical protein